MMTAYILRLLILVPLVAGLAFLALWLWRKVQPGMALGQRDRLVTMVDALPLGTTGRLAVVEFSGKRLLLAVARGQVQLISEAPIVSPEPAEAVDE